MIFRVIVTPKVLVIYLYFNYWFIVKTFLRRFITSGQILLKNNKINIFHEIKLYDMNIDSK